MALGESRRDGAARAAGVAEDAAPDLAPVVLERVIQVHGRCVRRGVRITVTDGPVDRGVFLDRFGGVVSPPRVPCSPIALDCLSRRRASRTVRDQELAV